MIIFRSSHRRCSVRKSVLKNVAKFTRKRLCQSLFFIKLQAEARVSFFIKLQAEACDLTKKKRKRRGLWRRCFPVSSAKFLRTLFLQNTSGWLLLYFLLPLSVTLEPFNYVTTFFKFVRYHILKWKVSVIWKTSLFFNYILVMVKLSQYIMQVDYRY